MDVICQTSEYSDYSKVRLQLLRSEKSTVCNWCVKGNSLVTSFIFLSHTNQRTVEVSMHILFSFLCSFLNIAFLCVCAVSVRYFPCFLPSGWKMFLFQILITASTVLFWGFVCVCVCVFGFFGFFSRLLKEFDYKIMRTSLILHWLLK